MKYRFLSALVVALALATVVGCSKSSPTTPSSNSGGTTTVATPPTPGIGTGQLTVILKDSPFSDAKAFLVTFSEVSVHSSGGGWVTVPFANTATTRTCDLTQLKTATDLLGIATLPVGHYTEIRLNVTSAMLYFDNPATTGPCATIAPVISGKSASVNIPSGEIKLNRPFDIGDGNKLQVLLDFDGDKSLHQLGNGTYQMSPVISVVSVQ